MSRLTQWKDCPLDSASKPLEAEPSLLRPIRLKTANRSTVTKQHLRRRTGAIMKTMAGTGASATGHQAWESEHDTFSRRVTAICDLSARLCALTRKQEFRLIILRAGK